MAAHRYWRLLITKNGGHNNVFLGELVLATAPGAAQAATGGTASASSVANASSTPASNAFDGSPSTYWAPLGSTYVGQKGSEHIQYDMGAGKAIDVQEIRVLFPSGVTTTAYPMDFGLFYSDDGINWTFQRGWVNQVFALGETKTFDATPLPSNQIINRVVIDKSARYNLAALVGHSTLRGLFGRVHLFRRATAPVASLPLAGSYYIAGSTTVLGQPFARRVDLVEQKSGLLARTIHTKEDGAFLFDFIGPGPWTVIGVDGSGEQNSVIYAHVTPSPMN